MFNFSPTSRSRKRAKTYLTTGCLPGYVDLRQPPTKRPPFKVINDVPFSQSVELVLPEELYQVIWQKLDEKTKSPKYAKAFLKLQDLLEGEIFNQYIKLGDVIMLSEGRPGLDNVYSLKRGVLTLEIGRVLYERCGLQGQPVESGGKKHSKNRYRIEYDLRLPSMLHGKKGFERLVWAAKNVLNQSLCWLVVNVQAIGPTSSFTSGKSSPSSPKPSIEDVGEAFAPLQKHHPTEVNVDPQSHTQSGILVPSMKPPVSSDLDYLDPNDLLQSWAYETSEWLGLVGIGSPRILETDRIDPYLSRYTLPDDATTSGETLRVLTWKGLLTPKWITMLFVELMKHSRTAPIFKWLALSVTSHRTSATTQRDGYTIILTPPDPTPSPSSSAPDNVDQDLGDGQKSDTGKNPVSGDKNVSRDLPEKVEKKGEKRGAAAQAYVCMEFEDSVA